MQYIIKNINDVDNNIINNFYKNIYISKKKKIEKLENNKKRKQSIIGELLLKELVENNYNINYEDLKFKTNKYGKPYISNFNINFNISHSSDFVIVAVSENKIGVDIEKIRKTNIKTIYQFATDNEIEYILSKKQNIKSRLFEIYTLKEAYFKMKGANLRYLKNVEFSIVGNNITCNDKCVNFKIIKQNDYLICICEKNGD